METVAFLKSMETRTASTFQATIDSTSRTLSATKSKLKSKSPMGSPKARTPSLQTVKMKIPLKTLSKYFLSNFTPNSIMEVFEMFQDTDPNILNDLYNQVGRNKDILVECMLNGGELPEQYIEQFTNRRRPQEDNKSDVEDQNLNNLVDLDGEADPETIARQIQMIE